MRRLRQEETGSTLLLTIFYSMLCLVLALLVTAATSLYLERKRLFTLADGAALVGAEAYELDAFLSAATGGASAALSSPAVASAVDGYIAAVPHDFEGLAVVRADSRDGLSATVGLSAFWRPPMITLLVPEGLRIEVETTARSVLG
ncbi:hypothetical protein FB562_1679 [Homoserinimonas aerilata]|uniref:Putative Flp pilus-assembly TadG-like N-terminal domain-containing protein n=1 Tax=Homoserinimonas aerilata TaxID=1162970 RepID=A0A542YKI7_9MICO|nr:pilus assembly protein TadG-related protein [Homoserinimonas aerilata]TQL48582.1 hypothetical protein FB562_1679 [Homoserinimonas aerilata]